MLRSTAHLPCVQTQYFFQPFFAPNKRNTVLSRVAEQAEASCSGVNKRSPQNPIFFVLCKRWINARQNAFECRTSSAKLRKILPPPPPSEEVWAPINDAEENVLAITFAPSRKSHKIAENLNYVFFGHLSLN